MCFKTVIFVGLVIASLLLDRGVALGMVGTTGNLAGKITDITTRETSLSWVAGAAG
jgi:hypothetical protein